MINRRDLLVLWRATAGWKTPERFSRAKRLP